MSQLPFIRNPIYKFFFEHGLMMIGITEKR
jgi:hypothetical protein